jgi:uncharacterized membrane protein YqiK
MIFKERTMVNLDDGAGHVVFEPGVQEVPESLADHWYVKRCATRYTRTPTEAKLAAQAAADKAKAEEDAATAAQVAADAEVVQAQAEADAAVEAAKAKAEARIAEAKSKAEAAKLPAAKIAKSTIPADPPVTMKHVTLLQRAGHPEIGSVGSAQAYLSSLTPAERAAFFANAAKTA